MRARDNMDSWLSDLEIEKDALIRKLNNALMELDKMNESKRVLSGKLAEQIQFVRDLTKAMDESNAHDDQVTLLSDTQNQDLKLEKAKN